VLKVKTEYIAVLYGRVLISSVVEAFDIKTFGCEQVVQLLGYVVFGLGHIVFIKIT
jgi:hypothetical protein